MTARSVSASVLILSLAAFATGAAPAPRSADPPDAGAEAHRASLSEVRDRAGSMPIDLRSDIDKRIAATVQRVNRDVAATGSAKIAAKLASKFGVTTEALLDLKADHGFSWGELVVAQTLLSDSKRAITLEDLASLRAEGWSWGALAYALGFHLEDLEDEIRAQGKIAVGIGKGAPEGK